MPPDTFDKAETFQFRLGFSASMLRGHLTGIPISCFGAFRHCSELPARAVYITCMR